MTLIFRSPHPTVGLAAMDLYFHEEVQMKGQVCNLDNFLRFLEVISFSRSSVLNITNISRECEVKRKTIENHIEILEDLLLSLSY